MRRDGYVCEVCSFKLWLPVADLTVSSLGLYDDERFPGRSVLVLREHHTSLEDLPSSLAAAFMEDLRLAGRAMRSALGVPRVNYAVLGNVEAHLHAHLIPRGADTDPIPRESPWAHPEPKRPLDLDVVGRLVQQLRSAIESEVSRRDAGP